MWPFISSKSLNTLILTQKHLVLAHIQSKKNTHPHIVHLQITPLHDYFYADSCIMQSTWLYRTIDTFISSHDIAKSPFRICLNTPAVKQTIINTYKSSPTIRDFALPELHKMIWSHAYIHPTTDNQFSFYVFGCVPQFLFQLKMILLQAGIKNTQVTTTYTALIQSYKTVYGSAYRPSQLAVDLASCNNSLELLFTSDSSSRLVSYKQADETEPDCMPFVPLIAGLWHLPSSDPLLLDF